MPGSPYCMIYLWWETWRENWSWSLLERVMHKHQGNFLFNILIQGWVIVLTQREKCCRCTYYRHLRQPVMICWFALLPLACSCTWEKKLSCFLIVTLVFTRCNMLILQTSITVPLRVLKHPWEMLRQLLAKQHHLKAMEVPTVTEKQIVWRATLEGPSIDMAWLKMNHPRKDFAMQTFLINQQVVPMAIKIITVMVSSGILRKSCPQGGLSVHGQSLLQFLPLSALLFTPIDQAHLILTADLPRPRTHLHLCWVHAVFSAT